MTNVPKININERISFDKIKELFPDNWVLLKNIHRQGNSPLIENGIFLFKSKVQKKAFEKIPELEKNGLIQNGDVLSVEYTGGKLDEIDYIFVI